MQDWNEVYTGYYWVRGNYNIHYSTSQQRYIVRHNYNTSNPTITGYYETIQQAKDSVGNA